MIGRLEDDRMVRLRILDTHHEKQLQGAYAEARDLGDFIMKRERDAAPIISLNARIRFHENKLATIEGVLGPVPRSYP